MLAGMRGLACVGGTRRASWAFWQHAWHCLALSLTLVMRVGSTRCLLVVRMSVALLVAAVG